MIHHQKGSYDLVVVLLKVPQKKPPGNRITDSGLFQSSSLKRDCLSCIDVYLTTDVNRDHFIGGEPFAPIVFFLLKSTEQTTMI